MRHKAKRNKALKKWKNTILFFTVFNISVITWFGGLVRATEAHAESKYPFLKTDIPSKVKEKPVVIAKPVVATIESYFYEYEWDAELMIAICKSENGYHIWGNKWKPEVQYTGNSNGSVDTGICMINSVHGHDTEALKGAEYNIQKAYEIWTRQGYEAWSCYNNGNYKQFLII